MRAVRTAHNNVLKQQLGEVNPKFHAGPNELELEPELTILQPTNAEQLKQLTALVERLRLSNLNDRAWQNAIRLWQMQITTGALSDSVKLDFVRRFYFWLLGRGTDADTARTSWGRGNAAVLNREVALYIEQFSQRRLDYALQLSLLAGRVPTTLNGYYLYFKYIVNGKLKRAKDRTGGEWWELSNDDYLQDFDLFAQEFDAVTGRTNYKDIIGGPANRPANQAPFDASRPYAGPPYQTRSNEQVVQQVEAANNLSNKGPLPPADDNVSGSATQAPVKVPLPNAPNTPVGVQAMGVAENPQITDLLGTLREFITSAKPQPPQPQPQAARRSARADARHEVRESEARVDAEAMQRVRSEVRDTSKMSRADAEGLSATIRDTMERMEQRNTEMLAAHKNGLESLQNAQRIIEQHSALLADARQTLLNTATAQPRAENPRDAAEKQREQEIFLQTVRDALASNNKPPPPPPPAAVAVNAKVDVDSTTLRDWFKEQMQQGETRRQEHERKLAEFAQTQLGNIADLSRRFVENLDAVAEKLPKMSDGESKKVEAALQNQLRSQHEASAAKEAQVRAEAELKIAQAMQQRQQPIVREVPVADAAAQARMDELSREVQALRGKIGESQQAAQQAQVRLAEVANKERAQGETIAAAEVQVAAALAAKQQAEAELQRVHAQRDAEATAKAQARVAKQRAAQAERMEKQRQLAAAQAARVAAEAQLAAEEEPRVALKEEHTQNVTEKRTEEENAAVKGKRAERLKQQREQAEALAKAESDARAAAEAQAQADIEDEQRLQLEAERAIREADALEEQIRLAQLPSAPPYADVQERDDNVERQLSGLRRLQALLDAKRAEAEELTVEATEAQSFRKALQSHLVDLGTQNLSSAMQERTVTEKRALDDGERVAAMVAVAAAEFAKEGAKKSKAQPIQAGVIPPIGKPEDVKESLAQQIVAKEVEVAEELHMRKKRV